MAQKKVTKRRVKKNVPVGVAHIHSTFNNTIVTITDLRMEMRLHGVLLVH